MVRLIAAAVVARGGPATYIGGQARDIHRRRGALATVLTRDGARQRRHELGMVMTCLVGVETERSSEDSSGVASLALSSMATASARREAAAQSEGGASERRERALGFSTRRGNTQV
jgi:hypothetical protein